MSQIDEIKKEIAKLPLGYISKKTIKGNLQYYLQWIENGKIKSKYIKKNELETISKSIERRKELIEKLNILEADNYVINEPAFEYVTYDTNVITDSNLKRLIAPVEKYEARDSIKLIEKYLHSKQSAHVLILYGLRRTGKTTLLFQSIARMNQEKFKKTAYIKIRKGQSIKELDRDLRKLNDNNYQFIFIDEVTLLDDFVDTASFLSDIYAAMGMKIVLSGTDSLGFWFTNKEELYDRSYLIHTTWIPFKEHSRLLKINDIDEYIKYGGTLKIGEQKFEDEDLLNEEISFKDDESTRRYIDTAIASNIQHSLKNYDNGNHYRKLRELYENDELTNAINRVIENMNHRFVLNVLEKDFESSDLALTKKNLIKEKDINKRTDALDYIDLKSVTSKLMELLKIKNKDNYQIKIDETHVKEIEEYLKALELISYFNVNDIGGGTRYGSNTLITQPGLRYAQCEALIYSLLKDSYFTNLDTNVKQYIIDKVNEEVMGRMMEEIVQLETSRRNRNKDVFKLMFDVGEIDMVIYNPEQNDCELYEIKHSDKMVKEQTRHLLDNEKCERIEYFYGKIRSKNVIYRGNNSIDENSINYINVNEYLNSL